MTAVIGPPFIFKLTTDDVGSCAVMAHKQCPSSRPSTWTPDKALLSQPLTSKRSLSLLADLWYSESLQHLLLQTFVLHVF